MKNVSYLARSGAIQRARGPRTTQRALAIAMALILASLVGLAACLATSARPTHAGPRFLDTPSAPTAEPVPAALTSPLMPGQEWLGGATVQPAQTPTPAARAYMPALAHNYAAPILSNCPGVNLCN